MKKISLLAILLTALVSNSVLSQRATQEETSIFKWYVKGVPHYSTVLPHGVKNYSILSTDGVKLDEKKEEEKDVKSEKDVAIKNVVPREKLCADAQNTAKIIRENDVIQVRDASGAVVELTKEQRAQRLAQEEDNIKNYCGPAE